MLKRLWITLTVSDANHEIISLNTATDIFCDSSLELPHHGGSNEKPKHIFVWY